MYTCVRDKASVFAPRVKPEEDIIEGGEYSYGKLAARTAAPEVTETQHQDSLYGDWRRRAQMIMSNVVGNVGIRNMFYHTNFGGEGCHHFRK
jgi:hypothetical protein